MRALLRKYMINRLWSGVAKRMRREDPYVIALTGTVGKTSCKEAIALVLAESGRPVVKPAESLNTEVGVPVGLFGLRSAPHSLLEWLSVLMLSWFPPSLPKKSHPYYVLEFSADKPGDIAFLAKKVPLDVAVLTAITPAHMLRYKSFADLVAEKASILGGLTPQGYAVLNADDPELVKLGQKLSHLHWYGFAERPSRPGVWAHDIQLNQRGLAFQLDFVFTKAMDTINKQQTESVKVQTSLIGQHQVYPLLAAAAVGMAEKVPPAKIKKALEAYMVPKGRGRLLVGQKDTTIIDDSYNASPESVKAGLQMLRPYAKERRVVAVLGRMNELGDMAEAAHEEVARFAAGTVDYLVVVGQYEKIMREAAEKAGLKRDKMLGFATTKQLADKLEQFVERGDVLYFKGSQNGVFLERAIKKILANPEEAKDLLVRQAKFWNSKA